jgi:hypothetical protein
MKTIKLKEIFERMLEKSNGIVDGFDFYCSTSIKERLEDYKGIKVYYWNIIPDGEIYYCQTMYIKDKL